jgi:hypothetical protein
MSVDRSTSAWKLLLASLCLAALVVAAATGSAAAQPNSMDEAKAMGDPAAGASVAPLASQWVYKGKEIPEARANQLGLACLQSSTQFTCFDTVAEMEGQASASRASTSAMLAECSGGAVNMVIYRHKQYEGTALGLALLNQWVDVPTEMNNATSSYRMGVKAGHFSDFGGGGGWWYPGATGYCDYHSNIAQPYPEWNDRISSRYRIS